MMAEEEYRRRIDEFWQKNYRRMRLAVNGAAYRAFMPDEADDLMQDLVVYTYERRDLLWHRLEWLDRLLPMVVTRHLIRNVNDRRRHSSKADAEFSARTLRREDVKETEICAERLPEVVKATIVDSMRANDDHSDRRAEEIALLFDAVASLDPLSKTIYQRLFVEGESISGLAERLGISRRSVSSAKAEMIRKVRDHFASYYGKKDATNE